MDILDLVGKTNIAEDLTYEKLGEISSNVCTGYDIDKESRSEWEQKTNDAKKIAKQVWEQKDFPFENAANIKYPLLATSAIQFSARAYPNFVKWPDVVRAVVIGSDPDGMKAGIAERISRHMSYQLLNEMEGWEEDTDKLLSVLPITGLAYKKTWYSPTEGRNVSEYRSAWDVVINYWAKSITTVPRITEEYTLYPNEIEERIRAGLFLDLDYSIPSSAKNETDGEETASTDPDSPHIFLEQHCYIDLDDDGYKEPYIVCVHKDSKQVARIVARYYEDGIIYDGNGKIQRIIPEHYYTKFSFMPSLDGSFYDFGFGALLTPINKTIDTTLNQLIDSGTLYNSNSGFIGKGIQLGRGRGGGDIKFKIGEWKPVGFSGEDLSKNFFPLPVKEPSAVLFNLLGFMVSAGEKLSSVTEILTGQQSNEAERPTTTLARIEQGLMVFSSIHKRLYKAFRAEYKKLFRLNGKYLNPRGYLTILDHPGAAKEDYDYRTCDVVPVADPNETTNTQKLMKAQLWMSMIGQGFNDQEIRKRFAEAMQVSEIEKILDAPPNQPDPKAMIELEKLKLEGLRFQFEVAKYDDERREIASKVQKNIANAISLIAKAEATEIGPQLEMYKTELQAITERFKIGQSAVGAQVTEPQVQQEQIPAGGELGNNQTGMGRMEEQPSDSGSFQDVAGETG